MEVLTTGNNVLDAVNLCIINTADLDAQLKIISSSGETFKLSFWMRTLISSILTILCFKVFHSYVDKKKKIKLKPFTTSPLKLNGVIDEDGNHQEKKHKFRYDHNIAKSKFQNNNRKQSPTNEKNYESVCIPSTEIYKKTSKIPNVLNHLDDISTHTGQLNERGVLVPISLDKDKRLQPNSIPYCFSSKTSSYKTKTGAKTILKGKKLEKVCGTRYSSSVYAPVNKGENPKWIDSEQVVYKDTNCGTSTSCKGKENDKAVTSKRENYEILKISQKKSETLGIGSSYVKKEKFLDNLENLNFDIEPHGELLSSQPVHQSSLDVSIHKKQKELSSKLRFNINHKLYQSMNRFDSAETADETITVVSSTKDNSLMSSQLSYFSCDSSTKRNHEYNDFAKGNLFNGQFMHFSDKTQFAFTLQDVIESYSIDTNKRHQSKLLQKAGEELTASVNCSPVDYSIWKR